MATKVVTGKVRFSYVNIFKSRSFQAGQDAKFSICLLIPTSCGKAGALEISIECCLDDVRILKSIKEFSVPASWLSAVDLLDLFLIIEGIADHKDFKIRCLGVLIDTGFCQIHG